MPITDLSLIFGGDYDRTRLLAHPDIAQATGLHITPRLVSSPHDVFHILTHSDDGEGGEMSLSFYSTLVSRSGPDAELVGLPVFISRMFRHGNILINERCGISDPSDLRGKTIGVPEFGTTMVVWLRGILESEHGVRAEDVKWRTGREPVALDTDSLRYPPGVDIARAASTDLVGLLAAGELDATIGLVPQNLPEGVRRLFPDYGAAERDYYRSTGIFPIMHVLVVRRQLIDADPTLAERLFRAAELAKRLAIAALNETGVLTATLPWLLSAMQEQTNVMSGELWSYGLNANRHCIQTFLDYAHRQGLLWNELKADDLFLPLDP